MKLKSTASLLHLLFFSWVGAQLHPSAAFQISSTTQGFLLPKMTQSQKEKISNPAEGLMVYDTDNKNIYFHTGTRWLDLVQAAIENSDSGTELASPTISIKLVEDPNKKFDNYMEGSPAYGLKVVITLNNRDAINDAQAHIQKLDITFLGAGAGGNMQILIIENGGPLVLKPGESLTATLTVDDTKDIPKSGFLRINYLYGGKNYYKEVGVESNPTLSFNGISYKHRLTFSGDIWLDRNIGASARATTKNDTNAYGDAYSTNSSYGHVVQDPFTTSPCPNGYSIPTRTQIDELIPPGSALNPDMDEAAWDSSLKLVSSGIDKDRYQGERATYWVIPSGGETFNYKFYGSSSDPDQTVSVSIYGGRIRCIKNRTIVHAGKTYQVIPSIKTGKMWLDRNLGANRVAASQSDAEAIGDLFQHGRGMDGHQDPSSSTRSGPVTLGTEGSDFILATGSDTDSWITNPPSTLWSDPDHANNPCPSGFKVPTRAEWEAEINGFSLSNSADLFNSFLKIPSTRRRVGSNGEVQDNVDVRLWSADRRSGFFGTTFHLFARSDYITAGQTHTTSDGLPVRCIER